MSPRLLFISHQAERSGAPLVLLRLVSWLSQSGDMQVATLLLNGGELAAEFAEVGPVLSLLDDPPDARLPLRLVRRLGFANQPLGPLPGTPGAFERAFRGSARRIALRELSHRIDALGDVDLVYVNTINSAAVLPLLPRSIPVITHVHELQLNIRLLRHIEPQTLDYMLARTDLYVAASKAVADALVDELGIDPARIELCHEFIPIDNSAIEPVADSADQDQLQLPPDTLIVGSVGTVEWRKGADLFIQVAKQTYETLQTEQDVAFVWVGPMGRGWELYVQHDVEYSGLADRVRFVGAVTDPAAIMKLFDVFVLTSRSDAFPLVCLEAAALAKPVVCFDAGGMREFLLPEENLIIPYLDVQAMAARVSQLLRSEVERQAIGERLARRVRGHHQIENAAPIILGCINRIIS